MTTPGTLLAILLSGLIAFFLGPLGVLALLAAIFGLTLSMHLQNKQMQEDLRKIKRHLGLRDEEQMSFHMSDEEIEQELYRLHGEGRPGERTLIDLEIEKEIERELEKELGKELDDEENKPGGKR
ncbi:hypothetical protein J2T17_000508 [Paenibacillus mucilaginosus]|uniref:hypothetical protein n=1 Tax=Paenibacillus mucilaginosus TaxID=61624 RepID=UPI003D260926